MRKITVLSLVFGFLVAAGEAALLVDFSPDTTGVPFSSPNYSNRYGVQIVGDQFTLGTDVNLTGGAIFGANSFSRSPGYAARFMIFNDPTAPAMINLTTALDAVNSVGTTTQPTLQRYHVTIPSTFLAAGTYWFALPGATGHLPIATGNYADHTNRLGSTTLAGVFENGDVFFQLEGTVVPEPGTLGLVSVGALALLRCRSRTR